MRLMIRAIVMIGLAGNYGVRVNNWVIVIIRAARKLIPGLTPTKSVQTD
jgi:hypothetical protein